MKMMSDNHITNQKILIFLIKVIVVLAKRSS